MGAGITETTYEEVTKNNMRDRALRSLVVAAAMSLAGLLLVGPANANPTTTTSGGGVVSIAGFRVAGLHANQIPASWHGLAPKNFAPNAVCSNPDTFWNENSSKVMEVYDSRTNNGATVDQWSSNGTNTQKWCLYQIPDSAPVFEIVNDNSGKCLDVTNDTPANGTKVQQWSCLGNENQEWVQGGTGSGPGNIWEPAMDIDHGYDFVLEVYGSSTADGGQVDIWKQNQSSTQYWCPVYCYG